MSTQSFSGSAFILRVDDVSVSHNAMALYEDISFLTLEGIHPIIVAPNGNTARNIVRSMNRSANRAVHVSGSDAAFLPGNNGEMTCVQPALIRTLTDAGYIPIVEPSIYGPILAQEEPGSADDIAGALGAALEASRIIFFHPAGGLHDPITHAIFDELTPAEALALAEDEQLDDSLRAAARAAALGVRRGAGAAQIVNSTIAHACVVEVLTSRHCGTQVTGGLKIGHSYAG